MAVLAQRRQALAVVSLFGWGRQDSGITEEDRRKLFWLLKRQTSYTAWARASAAFDCFAAIVCKELAEGPKASGSLFGGTDWSMWYPDILRAQLWFRRGLQALRRGDRSVWRHGSDAMLREALMTGAHWHAELMFGGPRCDHAYSGKYLAALKEAIRIVDLAQQDVGGLDSGLADTPAPHFWGQWLQGVLRGKPVKPMSPFVFPDRLPEVPIHRSDVLVWTGARVPVDGIWEPQVKNGCMNYMMGGTDARLLNVEAGWPRKVEWKLIWEDARYADGDIPVEEGAYFVDDFKAPPAPDPLTAASGELCPRDGDWIVLTEKVTRISLPKGRRMPQSHRRNVTWIWMSRWHGR